MSAELIQLSSSVKTVAPDAANSLERAWQRRRQELAGWQPSSGWLLKPQAQPLRVSKIGARGRM
jgi:hypothetical protein